MPWHRLTRCASPPVRRKAGAFLLRGLALVRTRPQTVPVSGPCRRGTTQIRAIQTLREINSTNARSLKAAWTFSTGVLRGHEGQPLVIDNTMYLVTPYPNVAYAIDLTQPGYPLRTDNEQRAMGKACCDLVNRGAAFAEGKLVYNLLAG